MPINRLAERTTAETGAYDFLKKQPAAIDTGIADTRIASLASRSRAFGNVNDVLSSLSQKYGVSPDLAATSAPGIDRQAEDLKLQEDQALAMRGLEERHKNINATFSFLSNRLQNAGIDRAQAEKVAQEYALDEDARKFKTSQNAAGREKQLKIQSLLEEFSQKKIALAKQFADEQRKDMIKNAIYNSFGMAAGIGVGFAVGGRVAAVVGSQIGSHAAKSAGNNFIYDRGGYTDTPPA